MTAQFFGNGDRKRKFMDERRSEGKKQADNRERVAEIKIQYALEGIRRIMC